MKRRRKRGNVAARRDRCAGITAPRRESERHERGEGDHRRWCEDERSKKPVALTTYFFHFSTSLLFHLDSLFIL
jgi:hypothetical protein